MSIKGQLEALLHVAFILVAGTSLMEGPPYGFLVAVTEEKENSGVSHRRWSTQPTGNDYTSAYKFSAITGHMTLLNPRRLYREISLRAQKLQSLKYSVNILNDHHMPFMVVLKINGVIFYEVVSILHTAQ